MEIQEIKEYNKRCAEFLGYVNTTPTDKDFNIYKNEKGMIIGNQIYTMIEPMSARFHSDWNWIMEVVEAIEKLGYESLTGGSEYYYPEKGMRYIQSFIKDDMTIYQEAKTKKESVVQAINQFLIWYNEKTN